MSYPRGRARALGLSLVVVLGLMALGASGAQGNWLILHNGGTSEAKVSVVVSAQSEGNIKVADAFTTEILCSTFAAQELVLTEKSTSGSGKVKFSGCKTWQSGKQQANCKPVEPIVAGGETHLVLHNGKNYLLYLPTSGKSFAVVEFGELCALGEEVVVTGDLTFECGHLNPPGTWLFLDCSGHQVTHLVRPVVPQSLFAAGIKFGANSATLSGIAAVSLSGLFLGDAWGGHI
jgi:hypothetical protein